jgi:TnpA family transposase
MGWVTASLLISRLQAAKRKSTLTRALQEYGRLQKTVFILRYLQSEEYRRRINRQINKGESLHALRRRIFFADEGKVRRRHHEEQVNQATCLTLVTNAAVLWNTVYLQAAIEQLRREGVEIDGEILAHLSPALYEHINPYGRFHFDVEAGLGRSALRPLRNPEQVA